MELKEYLDKYGIKHTVFAKQLGVTAKTLWNVINGHDFKFSLAIKIEEVTEQRVLCKDLAKKLDLTKKH